MWLAHLVHTDFPRNRPQLSFCRRNHKIELCCFCDGSLRSWLLLESCLCNQFKWHFYKEGKPQAKSSLPLDLKVVWLVFPLQILISAVCIPIPSPNLLLLGSRGMRILTPPPLFTVVELGSPTFRMTRKMFLGVFSMSLRGKLLYLTVKLWGTFFFFKQFYMLKESW